MGDKTSDQFGKVRSFLWPIYRSEYAKFIPVLLLFFLVTFNYNLLRAIKDTFIVTASQSGAEAIPFIKLWLIVPMALLMTFIFTRLSNRYPLERIFYIMISIFLGFFALFAFILYPAKDYLHPHAFADTLQSILPSGFSGMIAIVRNWSFAMYYVMCELWGVIMLHVLCWGFTNEIFSVKEAKRFYSLFAIGANASGIFSGQAAVFLSSNLYNPSLPFGETAWDQSVVFLNTSIILVGLVVIFLFRWFNKHVIVTQIFQNKVENGKAKIKMSMRQNFAYLAKSKYLICIALIVLTYNISINLVEVLWKNQMKELFPNPSDYTVYFSRVMTWMGVMATFIAIFISGNLIRKVSWTFAALVPPLIMLITGVAFFGFLFFKGSALTPFASFFNSTPLMMCVFFGSLQNCMIRACKYTLFDATKELSFVPLSKECKIKGKAAIDGVGSRVGKSGGALLFQVLLLLSGSLAASTPFIAIIFLVVVALWTGSVVSLGKQFYALSSQHEALEVPEKSPPLVSEKAVNPQASG